MKRMIVVNVLTVLFNGENGEFTCRCASKGGLEFGLLFFFLVCVLPVSIPVLIIHCSAD